LTFEIAYAVAVAIGMWLALELAVRTFIEWSLATDFYGSISREQVMEQQRRHGVYVARGVGWVHLGWIADPERESYRVERFETEAWRVVGRVRLGSFLSRESGRFRVWAQPRRGDESRLLGEVEATTEAAIAPVFIPEIAGPWRSLFRPSRTGDYVNDHTIYRDAAGDWRLLGITAKGRGDYSLETRFAHGVSADFPPADGMQEQEPVADFGEIAWAPHVVESDGRYHLYWSPHRLHRMTSADGVGWSDHSVVLPKPMHKFFRDAMILEAAPQQWLLYATARGAYFSRVDVYQSFDLEGWQYIGPALRTALGSERNAIFASTESPNVVPFARRYYLTVTYNNDSFFWTALLLPLKIWLRRKTYNDTLVFHSEHPYAFGVYRGRRGATSLVTRLEAHAPEIVHLPQTDAWYITTAGWPWAASLTSGEVAVAPLRWRRR
jgi:hypothetical protein